MPKKTVPERVGRLSKAFQELCAAGQWPPRDLTSDPFYPTYVYLIRPQGQKGSHRPRRAGSQEQRDEDPQREEDEYYLELIRRAYDSQPTVAAQESGAANDEILLRPSSQEDKIAKGVAVYEIKGIVFQIGEKRTPTASGVLGRVGVVDLICRKLEECLAYNGILDEKGKPWKLAIADLVRLIKGSMDPDEEEIAVQAKRLERLNAGSFVHDAYILEAAYALRLDPQDLFFDNSGVYTGIAFKERQKRYIDRTNARYIRSLKFQSPDLSRLSVSDIRRIRMLINIQKQGRVHEHFESPEPLSSEDRDHIARFFAIVEACRQRRNGEKFVRRAIIAIEKVGFHVWLGEYEDRVPVARNLSEALSEDPMPVDPGASASLSCAEPVAILAIGKANSGPPKVVVDLSHTARVGPDYRDY